MSKFSKTEKIVSIIIIILIITLTVSITGIIIMNNKKENTDIIKEENISNVETESKGLLDLAGNDEDCDYYMYACYAKMYEEIPKQYPTEKISNETKMLKLMAEDEQNSSRFLLSACVVNDNCNNINLDAYRLYLANPSKYYKMSTFGDLVVLHSCMAIIEVDCNKLKELYDNDRIHIDNRIDNEKEIYSSAVKNIIFINLYDIDLKSMAHREYGDKKERIDLMNSELKKYNWKGEYFSLDDSSNYMESSGTNIESYNKDIEASDNSNNSNSNNSSTSNNQGNYNENNYKESTNNTNISTDNNEKSVEKIIEMPNLIGLNIAQAEQKLKELGISYNISYITSFNQDSVFYQSISAGTIKSQFETINIKAYKKVNQVSAIVNITSNNSSYTGKTIKVVIDGKQCTDMMGNSTFNGSYSAMKFVNNPDVSIEIYIDDILVKSQNINLDEVANKNNISANEINVKISI